MKLPEHTSADQQFKERAVTQPVGPGVPWVAGAFISLALFLAENYMPADVIDGSVDQQVEKLQGSIVRELAYPMVAAFGIFWLIRARGYRMEWRSLLAIAWGALLSWCTLSIFWAQEPPVALKRLIVYVMMITGAAGAVALWPRLGVLQFISFSAAAHLTIGVLAEIAIGRFRPWVSDYRFAGTLHWNEQGFCCLVLVLSSLAAGDSDIRHRMMFRFLSGYGLIFMILTKSRSSMMGLAAALFLYIFLTRSATSKALLVIGTVSTTLLLYMTGIIDTIVSALTRNGEGAENLNGRQPLWELAMTYVHKRPIQGYGFRDFWTASNVDYFSQEFHWGISAAHNGYLEALLTVGYVGMTLHVLVLACGILRGSILYKRTEAPIFALGAALCLIYLVVGTLEAVLVIAPSAYAFYTTLLLFTLCSRQDQVAMGPNRLL